MMIPRHFLQTAGLVAVATGLMICPVMAGQLPNEMRSLTPTGAIQAPPSFYTPPQVDNPIQPPKTIPVTPGDQIKGPDGRPIPPLPPGVTGSAFAAAAAKRFPMTPQEIRAAKKMNDAVNRAKSETVGPPPSPVTKSITMSFSPGKAAPVIHLYRGNSTTLTFADDTGAPWPVSSVVVGDPKRYSVIKPPGKNNNMVVITPTASFANANNLVVALKGAPVPLVFNLETGGRHVDYEVNVGVAADGPNASPGDLPPPDLSATNDGVMQDFVDGVPPRGAHPLKTSSSAVQAWSLHGAYFVRTRLHLYGTNVGNMPTHIQNSVSGVHVYEIAPVPAVTVSSNGTPAIVTLEPKND